MLFRIAILLFVTCISHTHVFAQDSGNLVKAGRRSLGKSARQTVIPVFDTIWAYNGTCKAPLPIQFKVGDQQLQTPTRQVQKEDKADLIKIQGNITYDFLYRSFVDTPYAQNDYQQHTVQTSLNVMIRDRYPLRVNMATRVSNSPYFRNFMDLGAQFDQHAYLRQAKQQLLAKVAKKYSEMPELSRMETLLKDLLDKYNDLKAKVRQPDMAQRIIVERERQLYRKQQTSQHYDVREWSKPNMDLLNKGAIHKFSNKSALSDNVGKLQTDTDKKAAKLDSLEISIQQLQEKYDSLKATLNNEWTAARSKISNAGNLAALNKIALEQGIENEGSCGFGNFLSHIKRVGLGRSVLNYSELTAWNVALTGMHAEYNNKLYAAVAVGKIDYGFRDFWGKNTRKKAQQLAMVRVGVGDIEKNALILSAFTGRKNTYAPITSTTVTDHVNVAGYSLEAIVRKNSQTGLSLELAKTTKPVSGSFEKNNALKSLVSFSDQSNLGISLKAQTVIQSTDTRLSGFYRKTGEHFQSFSLFTYNTDQHAWSVKVDQSLLKNRVGLIAMLRRNDFTNPFTEKTFKTSTIFKSLQATVRIPRWPTLSVGYYPGTQLYIIDKERVRENAYYIVNGSLTHVYVAGPARMLSSILYNRYSTKGTDTGFIAYAGSSYMAAQTIGLGKLQVQGSYMLTDQEQMRYYTADLQGEYSIRKYLRAGLGAKYNKIMSGGGYWGGRVQVNLDIKTIGGLQLQYDKSYLPTIYKSLFPIETGRLTWSKYF